MRKTWCIGRKAFYKSCTQRNPATLLPLWPEPDQAAVQQISCGCMWLAPAIILPQGCRNAEQHRDRSQWSQNGERSSFLDNLAAKVRELRANSKLLNYQIT